jgi:hypothetical protein
MRLIAKSRVYYPSGGGQEYQPGDTFETQTDKDAEALVLVGLAEYPKKGIPPKKTLTLKTPEAIQSTSAPADDTKNLNEAPGAYRRRDMRSEG